MNIYQRIYGDILATTLISMSEAQALAAQIDADYFIIPRSEAPEPQPAFKYSTHASDAVEIDGIYASHRTSPERFRRIAVAHLALAEKVPELQAAEAKREAEKGLDAEAAALYSATQFSGDVGLAVWEVELLVDDFEKWRTVARKARELHGGKDA